MNDPAVRLIVVWVAMAAIMLAGIVALLVWAVRSRQFKDQDRAARLPLESGIPREDAADGAKKEAGHGPDRAQP